MAGIPIAAQGSAAPASTWTPPKLAKRPTHLSLGQGSSEPAANVRAPIAPYYVTAALILGGLTLGIASYYHRDSLAGALAFGTGTTMAGAALTLLIVDLLRK